MNDAKLMKTTRTKLDINQTEMAKLLGYSSQVSISRIEQGHTDMDSRTRAHLNTLNETETVIK